MTSHHALGGHFDSEIYLTPEMLDKLHPFSLERVLVETEGIFVALEVDLGGKDQSEKSMKCFSLSCCLLHRLHKNHFTPVCHFHPQSIC